MCKNADLETKSHEEMIKQKLMDYLWSLKDQTSARGTRSLKESQQEGIKAGFLILSGSKRGICPSFEKGEGDGGTS